MLTRLIDEISSGKASNGTAQQLIKLGVAKLPEIQKDNTDRNRTSPFAFTGAKFEFRAVGSSASTAFPMTLIHAAVAEALDELTEQLRAKLAHSKSRDDAVLAVVRDAFKESAAVRFEGNNYSADWVTEAKRRGLPNMRGTPEALGQLVTKQSRALFTKLGILNKAELESRYHVRMERYVKDVLIELHTLLQMVDTQVLPAVYEYAGTLAHAAAEAKTAGIKVIPQLRAANEVGTATEQLRARRDAMATVIERAETMHDTLEAQAKLLTSDGVDRMAEVRASCDALEVMVADDAWPLPKSREMLFPV
jgi:glutamine synthetase